MSSETLTKDKQNLPQFIVGGRIINNQGQISDRWSWKLLLKHAGLNQWSKEGKVFFCFLSKFVLMSKAINLNVIEYKSFGNECKYEPYLLQLQKRTCFSDDNNDRLCTLKG